MSAAEKEFESSEIVVPGVELGRVTDLSPPIPIVEIHGAAADVPLLTSAERVERPDEGGWGEDPGPTLAVRRPFRDVAEAAGAVRLMFEEPVRLVCFGSSGPS